MQNQLLRVVFTLALFLLWMSCGTSTQNQRTPIPSATFSRSVSSESTTASLPSTARVNLRTMRSLGGLFRAAPPERLDNLYATMRGKVNNLSLVTNCDLDVMKGFIAAGWPPIVLLQHGNKPRLWYVVGYDAAQQIYLADPGNNDTRNPTTADFETAWETTSASKCILITQQTLNEARVHRTLKKYLPSAKISQVTVRSWHGDVTKPKYCP